MGTDRRTLFVSGASGRLGADVLAHVRALAPDARVIAGTRDPARLGDVGVEVRRFDYDDTDVLDAALAGVDRLFLVSSDTVERAGLRGEQHLRAVAAARRRGVSHVVYTSLIGAVRRSRAWVAPDHLATESALADSGMGVTSLRFAPWLDFVPDMLRDAITSGELRHARGGGAIGYVTRADCARVAAAALADPGSVSRVVDVTGPELLTMADLAALASRVSGRLVREVRVDAEASRRGLHAAALPAGLVDLIAGSDAAVAAGEYALVTRAVEELTGVAAVSSVAWLEHALRG